MQYKYIFPFISNLKYIPLDIGKNVPLRVHVHRVGK